MTDYYSRARSRYIEEPRRQQEEDRALFGFGDVIAAPFRGIEGAVQDIYGLADTLTFDALPDYDQRFLGESETLAGGAIESVSNFLTAFIPVAGVAGKIGKATTTLGKVGQATAAGAVADFVAFGGAEERLSNLIQSSPTLANPITDFLAANEDDGELVGRLKNALEGAGLGVAADSIIAGVKGIRSARKAAAEGADPDEIIRATGRDIADADRPQLQGELAAVADRAAERVATDIVGKVNPRKIGAAERARQGLQPDDWNLSMFDTTDDAVATVRAAEELVVNKRPRSIPRKQNLEEYAEASFNHYEELIGNGTVPRELDRAQMAAGAQADRDALQSIHYRAEVRTRFLVAEGERLDAALRQWDAAGRPQDQIPELQDHLDRYADFVEAMRDIGKLQGRGLRARRQTRRSLSKEERERLLAAGGTQDFNRVVDDLLDAADNGIGPMNRVLAAKQRKGFFHALNEFRISALLYGPQTQIVNVLSGAAMTLYQPLEKAVGTAALAITGNREARAALGQATDIRFVGEWLTGVAQSFGEAFRMAGKAYKKSNGALVAESFDDLSPRGRVIQSEGTGPVAGAINLIGRVMEEPTKWMASSDEFFKQLNARATARTELLSEGYQNGLRGAQLHQAADDSLAKLIHNGQLMTRDLVQQRAVAAAGRAGLTNPGDVATFVEGFMEREWDASFSVLGEKMRTKALSTTFQTPLEPGSFSHMLQGAAIRFPIVRLVVPFVRTPVNILKYGFGRSPIGPTASMARDARTLGAYILKGRRAGTRGDYLDQARTELAKKLLSGDTAKQAEALGQIAAATGFSLTAWHLAAGGRITGGGPTDPEQRKALEQAGWQPYSVFVGDDPASPKEGEGYVAYARLDPFATVFGLFADMYDYARFAYADEQGDLDTVVFGVAVGIANNFVNKTYLQGVADATEAVSDPARYARSYSNRLLQSFVPNILGQGVSVWDDNYRSYEVVGQNDPLQGAAQKALNLIKARVPGLSNTLEPQRDILGQPIKRKADGWLSWINPIAYTEVTDSVVRREFDLLGHGFTPPRAVKNGLDLRTYVSESGQSAYDRWMELSGTLTIGKHDLQGALRKLIKSRRYQALSPISESDIKSPRVAEIKRVVRIYTQAAWRETLKEFEELRVADRQQFVRKRQAKLGLYDPLAGIAS